MRFLLVLLLACSSGTPTPEAAGSGSTGVEQPTNQTERGSQSTRYATRPRPPHTFDLLSAPAAAGQLVKTSVNLPAGWLVTGQPEVITDPVTGTKAAFTVVTARVETSGSGSDIVNVYRVEARNDGSAVARLVADVPCMGCP